MTEPETAPTPAKTQAMPAGGMVVAVVPQSVEEIFRLAKGIVQSGLAPYALTGIGRNASAEQVQKGTSAVAIVIMAGAELGLPPMVSLRSFTAINGRPALYGDGLINVVRRSGRAKVLKVGYTSGFDYRLFIRAGRLPEPEGATKEERAEDLKRIRAEFEGWDIDRRSGGFCEATRNDSTEAKAVVFTVAEAKKAALWQTEAEVMKDVWENNAKIKKKGPNDSPWYRYPERMLGWRAAGFCLRELFGDVLGGITDDWEAREIGGMIDITPTPTRSVPPEPPGDGAPLHNSDLPEGAENEADPETPEATTGDGGADEPDHGGGAEPPVGTAAFLTRLEEEMSIATDLETLEYIFDQHDIPVALADDLTAIEGAFELKKVRAAIIERQMATAAGQQDIFPGDR